MRTNQPDCQSSLRRGRTKREVKESERNEWVKKDVEQERGECEWFFLLIKTTPTIRPMSAMMQAMTIKMMSTAAPAPSPPPSQLQSPPPQSRPPPPPAPPPSPMPPERLHESSKHEQQPTQPWQAPSPL